MKTFFSFALCCQFFLVYGIDFSCNGIRKSETISDDCRTLLMCNNGELKTITCNEGEIVGAENKCIPEDTDLNACVRRGLTRRWLKTNRVLDCLWEWTAWSAPYGFGSRKREVVIYRHPENGGKPCPKKEVQEKKSVTRTLPPVKEVAKAITKHFLSSPMTPRKSRGLEFNERHQRAASTQKRDLLLILDSSGSIGFSNFKKMTTTLAKLLSYMCPKPDPFEHDIHRAAALTFSSNVYESFDFKQCLNTKQLENAITSINYIGHNTCTDLAFDRALGMFTNQKGIRSDAHHEVLILTDGEANCGSPFPAIERLKEKGVKVYALAVGIQTSIGQNEIEKYASEPKDKHLFAVHDFQDLNKLVEYVESSIKNGETICAPFDIS